MGAFHFYSIREQKAHNSFLEISAELGVAGLIAYLVMIFAPLRSLRRIEQEAFGARTPYQSPVRARGRKASDTYYLSVALQAALIAYVVCSFFGSIQYLWFLYYPLAYAVSLRRIHIGDSINAEDTASNASPVLKPVPEGVLWRSRSVRGRAMIEPAKAPVEENGGPNGY